MRGFFEPFPCDGMFVTVGIGRMRQFWGRTTGWESQLRGCLPIYDGRDTIEPNQWDGRVGLLLH